MRLSLALLADYANVSREGKLNIMGIFGQIQAFQFPAVHAQMHLVLSLEATAFDTGTHEFNIAFIDEDGHELLAMTGVVQFPESRAGESVAANQILALNGMVFAKAGTYEFVIRTKDEELGRVPLRVSALSVAPR
ncbi:MAG: hypothetical protein E6J26_00710 [Chloroflexi bacterium]|nr:MAG: hypothetical protein E6J26_00710 [Chloroflexota bacterium]